jgi:hypothetical protein
MIFLTGARLVTLTDEVTQQIQRFTEPPEADLEAGGILLGSYRGPHVEVFQGEALVDVGEAFADLAAEASVGKTPFFLGRVFLGRPPSFNPAVAFCSTSISPRRRLARC